MSETTSETIPTNTNCGVEAPSRLELVNYISSFGKIYGTSAPVLTIVCRYCKKKYLYQTLEDIPEESIYCYCRAKNPYGLIVYKQRVPSPDIG